MTARGRDAELAREAAHKAERLARARRGPTDVWPTLLRVAGLGWVLVIPLALGIAGGGLLARWLGQPWIVFLGLGLGLAAGVYGVYRQVRLGLANDKLEEPAPDAPDDERREP
jgi:F0F1-type ATP synthase assembly protein I